MNGPTVIAIVIGALFSLGIGAIPIPTLYWTMFWGFTAFVPIFAFIAMTSYRPPWNPGMRFGDFFGLVLTSWAVAAFMWGGHFIVTHQTSLPLLPLLGDDDS